MAETPKSFWEVLFKWMTEELPKALAAFSVGYKVGSQKVDSLNKKNVDLELQLEKEKNENKILKENSGKSDRDIVADAIREGSNNE